MSFLLVACNQSVEFTIYFDSNGGSEVSSISTGGNSAVVIPANPIKEGFEFDGWYWDNNTFNRSFTASSLLDEPISSNMTVYAKWTSSEEEEKGINESTIKVKCKSLELCIIYGIDMEEKKNGKEFGKYKIQN